jgi:opacity protein-like surface antigen
MKKFVVLAVLLFSSVIFSQGFKFGVGGGLTMIQGPDVLTKDFSSGGIGFGGEYHVGAKAKLSLPVIPLTPIAFLNYHIMSSSEEIVGQTFEATSSILSIGAGAEWSLLPGPLSPYLALDVAMNSFGKTEVKTPIGTFTTTGESRVGINIGAGAEFTLLPAFDIDASLKYSVFNLIGKESGEETVSALVFNVSLLF